MITSPSACSCYTACISHQNFISNPFLNIRIFFTAQGKGAAIRTVSALSCVSAIGAITADAVHSTWTSTTTIASVASSASVPSGEVDDQRTLHGNVFKIQKKIYARGTIKTFCCIPSGCAVLAWADGC